MSSQPADGFVSQALNIFHEVSWKSDSVFVTRVHFLFGGIGRYINVCEPGEMKNPDNDALCNAVFWCTPERREEAGIAFCPARVAQRFKIETEAESTVRIHHLRK